MGEHASSNHHLFLMEHSTSPKLATNQNRPCGREASLLHRLPSGAPPGGPVETVGAVKEIPFYAAGLWSKATESGTGCNLIAGDDGAEAAGNGCGG